MRRFLLRWFVNFLGLWTAATLLAGINYNQHISVLVVAALVFSLVNAVIRPIAIILALPAIVLTLGVFTLILNALMLWLVTVLYPKFHLNSFWTAIAAVIIVWLVNYLLDDLLEKKKS